VIVLGQVSFYQINKCYRKNIIFPLLMKWPRGPDEMASRSGFGSRAVVWRSWCTVCWKNWRTRNADFHLWFSYM